MTSNATKTAGNRRSSAAGGFGPAPRSLYRFKEVYIHGVDPNVLVFKSMSQPKKLILTGTDGRQYMVICKGNDQLWKDARVMDVNRVCLKSYCLQKIIY
jgi:serine/threonine-protein kinase ATR